MAEVLGTATNRFRDTIGELRGMTSQIQRELETTREELRRGVIELPQETQESTANMRRVVADQIKALNELASLVSRSNRVVDSAPAAQPRRVNEAPTAASSVAPQAAAPAPVPAVVARAAEPPQARPAPPTAAPERSTPPRREEASAARESAGRGGWLSDLLNRASRDEDQPVGSGTRAPQRQDGRASTASNPSISLSVDIARMIDHDAAVELWDRYKRGERNVFTRRLYTLQGQQTFDEIRKKYRATRSSGRPSTATSTSSSGCSPRSRATTATQMRGQDLPDLGDRQGLHHAGARERPVRLRSRPLYWRRCPASGRASTPFSACDALTTAAARSCRSPDRRRLPKSRGSRPRNGSHRP